MAQSGLSSRHRSINGVQQVARDETIIKVGLRGFGSKGRGVTERAVEAGEGKGKKS